MRIDQLTIRQFKNLRELSIDFDEKSLTTVLIGRNTTIPTSKSKTYSTASDNQASVEIHVLQGERGMASDNKSLGRFILDGILPSPRGMPQIEVAFDIDANGILHVSARDTGTGREQKITIQAGTGLSPEEIEQMKRDAEAHAEDDRKRREGVAVRNQADSLAYTAEKTMSEAGDKIPADVRADIDARVKDIRDALSGDASVETLRSAVEALTEALQKAGSAVYEEGAQGAGVGAETAAPGGEGEGGDEEDGAEEGTVEGEYREV
ncbi:MAG: Hsp70 family protein [Chloroflexi bacterium]|nr:Hsp70 family protein [Chloroflexota bacterium]